MVKFGVRVMLLFVLAFLLSFISCKSIEEKGAKSSDEIFIAGGEMREAQNMLRLDDFRQFETAELHFLTLRFRDREDVFVAGWLAQLYIAWAEQLRSEINLLRWKLTASEIAEKPEDKSAVFALIDYRMVQLKEVEESAHSLGNVLVIYNPDTYIGHRVMADYYRVMGDREKMEEQLMKVRKLNPDSVGLLFIQGAAKAQFDQDYEGAIAFYDQALERDPMFVKSLVYKGYALHELGREDEAKLVMQQVLQKSPKHPGAQAFLSAEAYISSLSEEGRERLKAIGPGYQWTPKPQIVTWAAGWKHDKPELKYRITGLPDTSLDVKVVLNLVAEGGVVLVSMEKAFPLQSGKFYNGNQVFHEFEEEGSAKYDVIIQLLVRAPGAEDYATLDVRQAEVPKKK